MKLHKNERCPIHNKWAGCCGREEKPRTVNSRHKAIAPGVTMITDEHHPRGYRIHRSKAAMRELLQKKVREQEGKCFYCHKEFEDFREVTPDHVAPKGMGSARKDDHEDNICAACGGCNAKKGSRRLHETLA